ncbi:MAG: CBS domain-containing protein [Candidatus Brocadiia bacterium]
MSDGSLGFYDMNVPVRAFVTKRLIGVECESSVQDAAQRMVEFNISSIAVIENGDIVGLFTDGDIKERVVAKGKGAQTSVCDVMTRDLVTSDIGTPVKDVLRIMAEKNIKHVLVTDNEEIVGIMTFRDLIDIQRHSLETFISRE